MVVINNLVSVVGLIYQILTNDEAPQMICWLSGTTRAWRNRKGGKSLIDPVI